MIVIAPKYIKVRFVLFVSLISILGCILGGTVLYNLFSVSDVSSGINKYSTVIIDPGHGGPDGGTSAANGTLEKEINLQIALKLNDILCSMGVETVMVRTEDISIHEESAKTIREKKISDIKNRLGIMNNTDNSVFVSIHQNHYSQSKYNGTQVFYSKNNPDSAILADSIRHSVITVLQPDNSRETKIAGSEIYLLHHAEIPAVMVECGFLSNSDETEKLKNDNYQRKLAFLIALGILDFINKTEAV